MTPAEKYVSEHVDENNAVRWPADEAAKTDVAQTLLGIWFVGNCDYWYEHARDLIVNPEPTKPYVRPWNEVAKSDRAYREVFATLTEQQKEAVLRLVRSVVDGTMYSALVTLDQFAHANVVVEFHNRDDQPAYHVQVIPGHDDFGLHDRWHEWVAAFSTRAGDSGGATTSY